MTIAREAKLSVRLPEAQRRRVKSVAAHLGLSLQEAVEDALEVWLMEHDPQSSRAHSAKMAGPLDEKPQKPIRGGEPKRPKQASRVASDRGRNAQAEDPEVAEWAWLRRAPSLDWSQRPVVELVTGKTGRFWVFRGTRAPLAAVLRSFMDGHAMQEIAERYDGLTVEQVNTALKFAAVRLLAPGPLPPPPE